MFFQRGHRFYTRRLFQTADRRRADSKMGEEEACPDLRLEEDVTLTNKDGSKENHSVQGHWQGPGQDQLQHRLERLGHTGTMRRPGRGRTTPSWTRRTGQTSRRPGRGRTLLNWTRWTGGDFEAAREG